MGISAPPSRRDPPPRPAGRPFLWRPVLPAPGRVHARRLVRERAARRLGGARTLRILFPAPPAQPNVHTSLSFRASIEAVWTTRWRCGKVTAASQRRSGDVATTSPRRLVKRTIFGGVGASAFQLPHDACRHIHHDEREGPRLPAGDVAARHRWNLLEPWHRPRRRLEPDLPRVLVDSYLGEATVSIQPTFRVAAIRFHGISTSQPRRRRNSSPQNIHVAAAASPRLVSTEYRRGSRGVAATQRLASWPRRSLPALPSNLAKGFGTWEYARSTLCILKAPSSLVTARGRASS